MNRHDYNAARRAALVAAATVAPEHAEGEPAEKPEPIRNRRAKISRNAVCPCGSGKKFKQCHRQPTNVGA
jgi:uncharacterized protein YecA (UPF0149 family)